MSHAKGKNEFFLTPERIAYVEGGKMDFTICIEPGLPFFGGHFPDHPILPGVLILDAMAESSSQLWEAQRGEEGKKVGNCRLTRVRSARFKRPVFPPRNLVLSVTITSKSEGKTAFSCVLRDRDTVNDEEYVTCIMDIEAI